jgi:peptidoglycan/LPS O-acetylase OafA/YrhL
LTASARLAGIDALRGIAALMVVGLHTQAVFGLWTPGWFSKGYLAVDFFLMLSGYLMARGTEAKLAAGGSTLGFVLARYRRFWPMMALGALIGAPYLWMRTTGIGEFLPVLFANLALLPYPFAGVIFALNIPAWYVFFDLVIHAAHASSLRRLGIPGLAGLALAMLVCTAWIGRNYGNFDIGARAENFWQALPRVTLAYVLGVLLWRTGGLPAALRLPGWLGLTILPGAMFASTAVLWCDWTFDLAFVLIVCPLALHGAYAIARPSMLSGLAGTVSFPLYATHLPVLEGMRELGFTWPAAVAMALSTALTTAWWTNHPRHRIAPATT